MSVIRVSDVIIERDHFVFFISKSKTDPAGEGQNVVVARNTSELDPWTLLRWYMDIMGFQNMTNVEKANSFLFPCIKVINDDGDISVQDNVAIKYTTVQNIVKSLAINLSLNLGKAGSHCLRVGGATGYTQKGVSAEVVMAKGRWRSETTRLKYTRVMLQDILETADIF